MVIGVGLDIVELERVERLLAAHGDRFIRKLMDGDEAATLPEAKDERAAALALAIAGKEAASKALGTGWSAGVRWRDVVLAITPPQALRLERRAAAVARQLGWSGRARVHLERRDTLAIGEVWLLS